jgi:hypothetical protein
MNNSRRSEERIPLYNLTGVIWRYNTTRIQTIPPRAIDCVVKGEALGLILILCSSSFSVEWTISIVFFYIGKCY